MNIVTVPNPVLYGTAETIKDIPAAKKLGLEMLKLMEESYGVGLAAPQINQSLKIFVASLTGSASDGQIYINPDITDFGEEKAVGKEGCLSIPGVKLPIIRSTKITLTYTDSDGKPAKVIASGVLARIIQHEFDHLFGILITDRHAGQIES